MREQLRNGDSYYGCYGKLQLTVKEKPMRRTERRCPDCHNLLAVARYEQEHGALFTFCSNKRCSGWTPREPGEHEGDPVACGVSRAYDRPYRAAGQHVGCGRRLGRVKLTIGTMVIFPCYGCRCAKVIEQTPGGLKSTMHPRESARLSDLLALLDNGPAE